MFMASTAPSAAPATAADPLPDVPLAQRPQHVAIIMDGNGRWAQKRGQPRLLGHRKGANAVRVAIRESAALGIRYLTLYSFSVENWKRPPSEVSGLMRLYAHYLRSERLDLHANNVRVRLVGQREGLPEPVLRELDKTIETTANNTGLTLCLALNYGAREELVTTIRSLARRVRDGSLQPEEITEQTVSDALYTSGVPDPDLVIRTAGELRVSNFLLWQISYAEFCSLDVLWPDFSAAHLHQALRSYARRERRFGGVGPGGDAGGV
jgi:undecaprenyl diphosphate synthase